MRQFILPGDWKGSGDCRLTGKPAHYLLRVLRLGPGDSFAGLDAEGRRRSCSVIETGEAWLRVAVSPPLAADDGNPTLADTRGSKGRGPRQEKEDGGQGGGLQRIGLPRIVLVQSMAKGPAMDLVVRQAAEAGVARIIPLAARRCVAKAEGGREGPKVERWERILREGLQQSGSPVATTIEEPVGLTGLPERLGPPLGTRVCLFLHEAPLAQTGLHGYLGSAPEEIVLCVGPEGGFAPEEVDLFMEAGFRPLLLPGAILRTETAALYAVASVEIIFAERSSWIPSP